MPRLSGGHAPVERHPEITAAEAFRRNQLQILVVPSAAGFQAQSFGQPLTDGQARFQVDRFAFAVIVRAQPEAYRKLMGRVGSQPKLTEQDT